MIDTTAAYEVGNHSRLTLPGHLEALARLEYVASRERGFALLTGPAGAGKSGILQEFANQLRRASVATVFVDARGCGEAEVLRECCDEFGLGCSDHTPAGVLRSAFLEAVRGRCVAGTPVVLMIDHADGLDVAAVRFIERLLHVTSHPGGLTLVTACREPAPAALSTIARDHADVRISVTALDSHETETVVAAMCAADQRRIGYTPAAMRDIHSLAQGDLRRINRLWRLTQVAADLERKDRIDAQMVDDVAAEIPE